MIRKILKDKKTQIKQTLIFVIIFFIGIFTALIFYYNINKNELLTQVDKSLLSAVLSIPALSNHFLEYNLKNDTDYIDAQNNLQEFCDKNDLLKIFTVTKNNEGFFYTLSNKNNSTGYNEKYENPPEYLRTFQTQDEELYKTIRTGSSASRIIIKKIITATNEEYIAVVQKDLQDFNFKLLKEKLKIIVFILIIIILSLPVIISYYISLKKELAFYKRDFYIEPLTGMPNRNKLILDLKYTKEPSLFLINIDSFKEINDFFGYKCGDYILKEMINRLLFLLVSDEYSLYKMESDEYAILLDKKISLRNIELLAKYFNEAIKEQAFIYEDNEIHLTVTTGISVHSDVNDEKTNLLIKADVALKKAMNLKKEFLIYKKEMSIKADYEKYIIWSKKLLYAIKHDLIVPYFQPIINNENNIIEKYECLVRMLDNDKVISPADFLGVAKKTKFYHKITQLILKKSMDVFKNKPYEFSVNLSVYDIMDEETYIFIMSILDENKELAKKVVFELLESEGIENYNSVISFIKEVKEKGCKVAIDDFGTGYSNFNHILKLDVEYIKIDSSLIKNIDNDKNSFIIVYNINKFAQALGFKTIAEYVYSDEIFKIIQKIGINYSQGYLIGKPQCCIE